MTRQASLGEDLPRNLESADTARFRPHAPPVRARITVKNPVLSLMWARVRSVVFEHFESSRLPEMMYRCREWFTVNSGDRNVSRLYHFLPIPSNICPAICHLPGHLLRVAPKRAGKAGFQLGFSCDSSVATLRIICRPNYSLFSTTIMG